MSRINGPADLSTILKNLTGASRPAVTGGAGSSGPGTRNLAAPPQRDADSIAPGARPGQSLSVRRLGDADFTKQAAALDELGEVLESLDRAIKQTGGEARGSDGGVGTTQQSLHDINRSIERAEALARRAGLPSVEFGGSAVRSSVIDAPIFISGNPAVGTPGVDATFVGSQVRNLQYSARLEPGQVFNADISVTGSAQLAGFVLSFGGHNLNLGGSGATDGADDTFTIEIRGRLGSRELSFASGTPLTTVTAAINLFSDVTGVRASESGTTRIRLSSDQYGSDEFVAVQVINSGAVQGGGIYELRANDASRADPARVTSFLAAANRITDFGQNVVLGNLPPGSTYTADGTRVHGRLLGPSGAVVKFDFDLLAGTPSGVSADRLGLFRAFTLWAPAAQPAEAPPPGSAEDRLNGAENYLSARRGQQSEAFAELRRQFALPIGPAPGAITPGSADDARALIEQIRRSRLDSSARS